MTPFVSLAWTRCAVRGIGTRNARCRRLAPFIYAEADDGQPTYHDVIVRLTEPVTWLLSRRERCRRWTFPLSIGRCR